MLGFIGIFGFTQTDWVTYRNEFIMDRVQYAQVSMGLTGAEDLVNEDLEGNTFLLH